MGEFAGLTFNIGVGYHQYASTAYITTSNNYYMNFDLSGGTFAVSTMLGIEGKLSPYLSVGANMGLTGGLLSDLQMEDRVSHTTKSVHLNSGSQQGIGRVDLGLFARLTL